ncbi:hypothetical protein TRM7557_01199 [Tritonibacter multivorans]|uniref:Uncharacterized protein n=1 Tax=Tritonibacter multivorans TaxID=928856 RepID=A0A0P1G5W7_9RHOB|nr:hypothetical protein TRM7557_01199 [Tritonibacter multivorans]SFD64847.1 hypothetical protein SAMN04488049_11934 [Tritonibacter multivorans]
MSAEKTSLATVTSARVIHLPRHPARVSSYSDGRSPDLRVTALPVLPRHSPVDLSGALSAHSCGGSHGVGAFWLHRTVFPISPSGLRRLGPSVSNEHISSTIGKIRIARGTLVVSTEKHASQDHIRIWFRRRFYSIQDGGESDHRETCLPKQRFAYSAAGAAWAKSTETPNLQPRFASPQMAPAKPDGSEFQRGPARFFKEPAATNVPTAFRGCPHVPICGQNKRVELCPT